MGKKIWIVFSRESARKGSANSKEDAAVFCDLELGRLKMDPKCSTKYRGLGTHPWLADQI
jgi:hypothetical protein